MGNLTEVGVTGRAYLKQWHCPFRLQVRQYKRQHLLQRVLARSSSLHTVCLVQTGDQKHGPLVDPPACPRSPAPPAAHTHRW